ncbi:MAG TPA: hypothetical protein DER33_08055 [Syntrophomonas sp.]|jgi:hypothetical protein|nr:hypothetical protein [Syntrophomonas sp.]
MNIKGENLTQLKKAACGTIAVIGICALVFGGITQAAKASLVNQTETIPNTYSAIGSPGRQHEIPAGYVKAAYQVKLSEHSGKPGAKDMSMEEAAELGAQNLWRFFGVNLDEKTIEMTYTANSSFNPRAEWEGIIFIDKIPSYSFLLDAVTGEYRSIQQSKYWSGNIDIGMDQALMENHGQYAALAKEMAAKFHLVAGQIVAAEYYGQGYTSFKSGVNPDITMSVKSDTGQEAHLTFSRYNQELLGVEYDPWVKDAQVYEAQMEKEMQQSTRHKADQVQDKAGIPSLIEIKEK